GRAGWLRTVRRSALAGLLAYSQRLQHAVVVAHVLGMWHSLIVRSRCGPLLHQVVISVARQSGEKPLPPGKAPNPHSLNLTPEEAMSELRCSRATLFKL